MSHAILPQAPQFPAPQAGSSQVAETFAALDVNDACLRAAASIAIGIVLALVYRATHKGLSYSQSFTQTIVFVAVIVAIVLMTVRNSVATAFTLVGALSIIRFRTVVKDTRDTAFVFGALALGMAAGLGFFEIAALGTVVVCGLAFAFHATNFGAMHKSEFVLRFTFDQDKDSSAYVAKLGEFSKRSNLLHIEPSGDSRSLRLTFDITMQKGATAEALTSAMSRIAGVSDVVLIASKGDVEY